MKSTEEEMMDKEKELINFIEKNIPNFIEVCNQDVDKILLHQDAFAADYQEDEYRLLGAAIKYAGLMGKEVTIIGTNRETLQEDGKSSIVFN